MAVVTISASEITALTGLEKGQVLESLGNLGMPSEESDGEIAVEVTPNRPDLFSVEGIARALDCFHGKKPREYKAAKSDYSLKVDSSVGKARPYVVAAVVRGVRMDESALKSIIQLQEKLHETVGRKRKKLAIGVHNADSVAFPLTYKFVKDEKFIPLDFDREMDVGQILSEHPKGKAYAHIVRSPYPVICDQKGVLSLPPIINSERTRVTEKTRNLVIEITGTHLGALSGALNIIVCALAYRGGEICEVKVGKESYPKLEPARMEVDCEGINRLLGEKYEKKRMLSNLARLGWTNDGKAAFVPPYRMDVSHYADLAEDIAIAHGYNEFAPTLPNFFIPGRLAYNNEDLRQAMIGLGFIEVVNYALTNKEKLAKTGSTAKPVGIINPKTEDFTLLRTSLAASLLENIAANKTHELPLRIFEVGRAYENGEKIHLCFAISAETLDFSRIRGVLQSLSLALNKDFALANASNKLFVEGRCAELACKNTKIGYMGEVAPRILEQFGVESPVALCEIEITKL